MATELRGCCRGTHLNTARHRSRCQRTVIQTWLASGQMPSNWALTTQPQLKHGRLNRLSLGRAASNEHTNTEADSPPAAPAEAVTVLAAQGATSRSSATNPPLQQRGRMKLEQMQREARAKLGDMVRQQLEADRQQQQQQAVPPEPTRSRGTSSSDTNAISSSNPPAMTYDSQQVMPTAGAAASAQPSPSGHASPSTTASSTAAVAATTTTSSSSSSSSSIVGDTVTAAAVVMTPSTATQQLGNEWELMRQEWAEEWQGIRARWQQFLERPLDPPPRPVAVQTSPGTATGSSESEGGLDGNLQRRALVSRALQLGCVATFVAQWMPVVQALNGGAAAAAAAAAPVTGRELWLALLVAIPPTPLTLSWQADAVSLSIGNLGCLLTSSLLHSGLLSLVVSLASLDETLPWLETLDGFAIMLLSYGIAGVAAGLAQMCLCGQASGIAGLGAAVGMEVAVALRCWRYTGGQLLLPTPACIALMVVAALMAAYQPLVGPWGILGGIFGGALSAVLAYDILYIMRVVLAMTILLGVGAWSFLTWLPRTVWRVLIGLATTVWGTLVAIVQSLRGV